MDALVKYFLLSTMMLSFLGCTSTKNEPTVQVGRTVDTEAFLQNSLKAYGFSEPMYPAQNRVCLTSKFYKDTLVIDYLSSNVFEVHRTGVDSLFRYLAKDRKHITYDCLLSTKNPAITKNLGLLSIQNLTFAIDDNGKSKEYAQMYLYYGRELKASYQLASRR